MAFVAAVAMALWKPSETPAGQIQEQKPAQPSPAS
jgi:hypothetical protein